MRFHDNLYSFEELSMIKYFFEGKLQHLCNTIIYCQNIPKVKETTYQVLVFNVLYTSLKLLLIWVLFEPIIGKILIRTTSYMFNNMQTHKLAVILRVWKTLDFEDNRREYCFDTCKCCHDKRLWQYVLGGARE